MESQDWREELRDGVIIRTRQLDDGVTEYIGEADLNADASAVQDVLTSYSRYPSFMPYTKETKVLKRTSDGGALLYSYFKIPFFEDHDSVIELHVDSRIGHDREFRAHWFAVPDAVAPRNDAARVAVNEGDWVVRDDGNGRSHVIYRFAVKPTGKKLPSFAVEFGRKAGVMEVFHALESEANLRTFRAQLYGRRKAAR